MMVYIFASETSEIFLAPYPTPLLDGVYIYAYIHITH